MESGLALRVLSERDLPLPEVIATGLATIRQNVFSESPQSSDRLQVAVRADVVLRIRFPMQHIISTMLLLALCATSTGGASDAIRKAQPCDAETLAVVGKSMGQQGFRPPSIDDDEHAPVVAAACKALPNDKRIILVAVGYLLPGEQADDKKGLLVAMLDTQAGKLIHSFKKTIEEDSVTQLGRNSLWLDTAPYLIAPDVRAFGLVFTSEAPAPRGAEGWGSEELVLFVPDADALKPIFQLVLDWWEKNDEGSDESSRVQHSYTVGVGDRVSHGSKDLIVNETIETGAADGKVSSEKRHHVVRFDGSVYTTTEPWYSVTFGSLLDALGHRT
jgi:hypothetical protein